MDMDMDMESRHECAFSVRDARYPWPDAISNQVRGGRPTEPTSIGAERATLGTLEPGETSPRARREVSSRHRGPECNVRYPEKQGSERSERARHFVCSSTPAARPEITRDLTRETLFD